MIYQSIAKLLCAPEKASQYLEKLLAWDMCIGGDKILLVLIVNIAVKYMATFRTIMLACCSSFDLDSSKRGSSPRQSFHERSSDDGRPA